MIRRRTRLPGLLCVLCVAALLVAGCSVPVGADVDAVEAYANALEPALGAESLEPLREVATGAQVERVRLYVTMLLGEGRRTSATLTDITVTSVERADGYSVVETRERWSIEYSDVETGAASGAEEYEVTVAYTVVLSDGVWRVSEVQELEREINEPGMD